MYRCSNVIIIDQARGKHRLRVEYSLHVEEVLERHIGFLKDLYSTTIRLSAGQRIGLFRKQLSELKMELQSKMKTLLFRQDGSAEDQPEELQNELIDIYNNSINYFLKQDFVL